jgi:hypothetical protein
MSRWLELVTRLAMAGLLGAGLMLVPGPRTEVVVRVPDADDPATGP